MKPFVVLGIMLLILSGNAHAYLDPGSGSAILQGILGALAALAITLKLYWHRLLRLFGLRRPVEYSDSGNPEESDRSRESGS